MGPVSISSLTYPIPRPFISWPTSQQIMIILHTKSLYTSIREWIRTQHHIPGPYGAFQDVLL